MWDVSEEFLGALTAGLRHVSRATVTVGEVETELEVAACQIQVRDGLQHRQVTGAEFGSATLTPTELYDLLSSDAAILRIWTGIRVGLSPEWVPVFTGRLSIGRLDAASGTVSVTAADFGFDLSRQELWPPVVQAGTLTRREAVAELVEGAFPGITIVDEATDTGTLGTEQTWTGKRSEAIESLLSDGAMEGFFLPDGRFLIRDIPDIGTPVYTVRTGEQGTIKTFERERPLDQLFNCVVMQATATDGSQGWDQVTAQIDDPLSPRHPDKIGLRTFEAQSFTGTEAEALAAAEARLRKVTGRTETVRLGVVSNPALEYGDTVALVVQGWLDRPAMTFTHIIDSLTFDLVSWHQDLSTRNLGVLE